MKAKTKGLWLKPPYAKKFYVPCVMHDDGYDKGGTEEHRKVIDALLYWRMISIVSGEKETTPCKNTWFVLIAFLYYVSVRIFGRFYFNYIKWEKKKK